MACSHQRIGGLQECSRRHARAVEDRFGSASVDGVDDRLAVLDAGAAHPVDATDPLAVVRSYR
jgi:hypothetical protein